MRKIATCLFLTMLAATGANAWWCVGHMVIAEIARQALDSDVATIVQDKFTFINQWFPQSDNMVSGACWADDLKSQGLEVMEQWHFINQPYNPDNINIQYPIQIANVAANIMSLDETLEKKENDWIEAFAMANLVHFYGDIHQPFHAIDLFDNTYPQGDHGGNEFHVYYGGKQWALHFIWDSVCGQYQTEPTRPLSTTDADWIKSLATQYTANYTVPSADAAVWNATIIAQESFTAAVTYGYDNHNLQPGTTLSDDYINTCLQITGYRISYAGARLAHDLNHIFGKESKISGKAVLQYVADTRKRYGDSIRELHAAYTQKK